MATLTIGALLAFGTTELADAAGGDARLEAEVLLRHALGIGRAELLAGLRRPIPAEALTRYDDYLRRRVAREPLAYITGEREFYGRPFRVSPAVLIPRPETEALVEEALRLLQGRERASVLDVGTGSGAIAISLALERPGWEVSGVDLSGEALEVARENAARLGAAVRLQRSDLLAEVKGEFDLIAANLPYVPDGDRDGLQREIREHEPPVALFGGPDGLDLIRQLLEQAPPHLGRDGWVVLECMVVQVPVLLEEAALRGYREPRALEQFDRIAGVVLQAPSRSAD